MASGRLDSVAPLGGGDRRHRSRPVRPVWWTGRTARRSAPLRWRRGADRRDRRPGPGRRSGILGPRLRRPYRRAGTGRRGLLQHRHDRLPGDADRPVLCRTDHHLHLPAYRQRRHQRGGHRGRHDRGARTGGEAGRHRAVQLAVGAASGCLAARAWDRRRRGRGYAGADRAHPRRRCAERRAGVSRRRPLRPAGAARAGRGMAGAGGHGPRQGGVLPAVLRVGRDALGLARGAGSADRAEVPRGRGRLRGEAQHPALPGVGRMPGHRGAGDGDRR